MLSVLAFATLAGSCHQAIILEPIITFEGKPLLLEKPTTRWTFDHGFPESLKGPIRRGFRYWNEQSGKKLFQEIPNRDSISPATGVVVTMDPEHSPDDRFGESSTLAEVTRWFGRYGTQGAVMIVFKDFEVLGSEDEQESVARHEVGHIVGFNHFENPRCLMYAYVSGSRHPIGMCPAERRIFNRYYVK